jgi:hypothetical protein
MKDVLEAIAQRDVPENVNLMPFIASRLERKSLMMTLRTRPVLLIMVVLLTFALLTGVVYAIGNLLGYTPGIGLVDQSAPIHVLEKPIKVRQGTLTIRVLKVVADATQTLVVYSVNGIPARMGSQPICGLSPSLRLPNGTELQVLRDANIGGMGSENGFPMSYQTQISYAPVPAKIEDIVLVFPCILPIGIGPENLQVQIHLSPAPKDYATPAVEIGATFVASNPTFVKVPTPTTDMRIFTAEPPNTLPATPTPAPNGSGLYLEKVIELPNSYILVGNFTDAGDMPGALVVTTDPYEDLPHIEDGTGDPVAFRVRADVQPEMGSGVRYWAFEIAKPVRGPLKITLDQVNIANFYTFEFNVNVGSNPQTGQKWELNLPVQLGNYEYVMDSVEMIENGYLFKYHSGTDVPEGTSPMFLLIGPYPKEHSGELRDRKTIVEYSEKLVYWPPLPTGQLTIELTSDETTPLQGPWTLIWTPPSK